MSRPIKIHTPAGRIRILDHGTRKRISLPFDPFPEEPEQTAERATPAESVEAQVVQPNPFDVEKRLNDEYRAGFEEGRRFSEKTLRDELAAQLAQTRTIISNLSENIAHEYQRLQNQAERSVVTLSLAIAERIVKREIAMDDDVVVRQIHEATKRIIGVERIKIRVNPAEEEFVREHRTQILATTNAVRDLVVEGDEGIERGGCILESESGNVDALIATQMERISNALLGDHVGE